jgi:hypothetical protein
MKKRLGTIALILALVLAALPASHAAPADVVFTYTVKDTSDSGTDSLRWAINQANADGGTSVIEFDIPEIDPGYSGGVWTIQPHTPLPALVEDGITIDGYSQPGAVEATAATTATIVIEIDGTDMTSDNNGFNVLSAENTIKGLAINRFDWSGIAIGGTGAMSNTISGNYIGVDVSGTTCVSNTLDGVSILLGAHDNTVGGDDPADWNMIGCNGGDGVGIYGDNTTGNVVKGNHIGTSRYRADLGNVGYGVNIYGGAHGNIIGGDKTNAICNNDLGGIRIAGANTRNNVIAENSIGFTSPLGNDGDGVVITSGAHHNTIGPGNGISGNDGSGVAIADGAHDNTIGPSNSIWENDSSGVYIYGTSTMSNTVSGNYIYYNASYGIYIGSANGNTIGGDTESDRNIIYGNDDSGVVIYAAQNNTVSGNTIGIDSSGGVQANGFDGVALTNADHNTVGPGNVISGNARLGIFILEGQDNVILGNHIGADADGMPTSGFGNGQGGIRVDIFSTDNVIGGDTTDEGNLIYNNGGHGVQVIDVSATGNTISHNSIEYNVGEGIKAPGGWTPSAPTIAATTLGSVRITGTACAGCTVEVFQSHLDSGEGLTFVGETVADSSGAFTVTVSSLSSGAPYLTATATDATSTTSEFSDVFESTVSSVYLPFVLRED